MLTSNTFNTLYHIGEFASRNPDYQAMLFKELKGKTEETLTIAELNNAYERTEVAWGSQLIITGDVPKR